MNRLKGLLIFWLYLSVLFVGGCVTDQANSRVYPPPAIEAQWIRDGQPLEFEGQLWYPTDFVETFLDDEVYLLGEYSGVQFFVVKTDVRPYERLYTKFNKYQFRAFEPKAVK